MRILERPEERYLLVINPMSRMGRGIRRAFWLINRLVLRRAHFEVLFTRKPGHAERLVADYDKPVDVVVAIGGDGTVQEVINGIMQRVDEPTFAIMPAGRGNDFSYLLGIGDSKRKALKFILSPDSVRIDLLKYNDRYAGNGVGIGFDAEVQERSGHYKYLAVIRYLINAMLILLKGADTIPMRIKHAGGAREGEYVIAFIGHTKKYAKRIWMFPGLSVDGGIMRIMTARPAGRIGTLVMFLSSGLGLHRFFPQVEIIDSDWAEIEVMTTAKAVSDGDLFYLLDNRKLRIDLMRKALGVKGSPR